MSLATRCTACGTVFRVAQDQLKVSEGWVRCGRCNEVFNALQGLFDLERETPPEWPLEPPPPGLGLTSPGSAAESSTIEAAAFLRDPSLTDRIDAQLLGSHFSDGGSTPAARINQRDRLEFPDARFDPELMVDSTPLSEPGSMPMLAGLEPSETFEPKATPDFVQRAQRRAQWRSRKVRSILAVAAVLLLMTLGIQGAHHFRNLVAARWPVVKPVLSQWCAMRSCSIDDARRIDDVFVESSALTRAAAPDAFKLSIALRNRGTMVVAVPSVDLSLTDAAGQLVARRVLMPREFSLSTGVMQPGTDTGLQLLLTAGNARVSGYTVEIFYP